ncbi:N-succinylarginine dihydrolase [Thermodesulfobacteriota bacterium]
MPEKAFEVNFDGIVGPTHSYGGHSYGNVASMRHELTVSNPRAALLEGLNKMRVLAELGLKQAVLPPHERPDLRALRRLGFTGTDRRIIEKASKEDRLLLNLCYSASGMWAANAATVSPSADTGDGRVHFTPANLVSQFHRSLEADFTGQILKAVFPDQSAFAHHEPLRAGIHFSDEGAANHSRFCTDYSHTGVEMFVYGRRSFSRDVHVPDRFPARQTLEASTAVARLHGLDRGRTVFVRQSPEVIDAGVFHNDVVAVGNKHVLFFHSLAFSEWASSRKELETKYQQATGEKLVSIEVDQNEVSIEEAVDSYLFNSQLVTLPDETMCLIAPVESLENAGIANVMERITQQENPIGHVRYVDVRQSMKNGGGPACLRLRVVLTREQMALTHQAVYFTKRLHEDLTAWGQRYYRDGLHPNDLADPSLMEESRAALDTLTQILGLGSVYPFQQGGNICDDG